MDKKHSVTLIDANGQVTKYLNDERESLSEVWESPKLVTSYSYDYVARLGAPPHPSGG